MYATSNQCTIDDVDESLLPLVLRPYFPHSRYLRRASIDRGGVGRTGRDNALVAKGHFSIPTSSYIESTGHFNASEFIICFNQLGYYMLAETIRSKIGDWELFPKLKFDTMRAWQLAKVVIAKADLSFKTMLDARSFQGRLEWIRARPARGSVIVKMQCAFEDDKGGYADGAVTTAVLDAY